MNVRASVLVVWLSLLTAGFGGCARGPVTPPQPKNHVTDNAGLLTEAVRASLSHELTEYQALTGHHVLVWIGGTTNGEIHSNYCTRVFREWGTGRKGYDDGVILWYFAEDRVALITVGYGLEGALPDREAARIYLEVVAPSIRKGHTDEAFEKGVAEILRLIDKSEAKAR